MNGANLTKWTGTGRSGQPAKFKWSTLLWSLIYPQRAHRILPTVSGVLLIALSLGIGMAAYNAANNILFITLSLMLACLILSGVLSGLNFRRTAWRLRVVPPFRAGQDAVVTLAVRNGKRFLPTYGLWFDWSARVTDADGPQRAETTFTARGADVRAALARAGQALARGRLYLGTRLDAGAETQLEWTSRPAERGRINVELESVGSLFPFGFLKKSIGVELQERVVVWPAPVEYRRWTATSARRTAGGERMARAGAGSDLLALRRYEMGDSHRLIHWKASARTRRLLVRQFAAESAEGFSLWLQTDDGRWTRPEQFELLVSFAATLAEDLFRMERLASVALDDGAPIAVRQVRDLESFLDLLAVVKMPAAKNGGPAPRHEGGKETMGSKLATRISRRNSLLTFVAEGPRGVAAMVEGRTLASA